MVAAGSASIIVTYHGLGKLVALATYTLFTTQQVMVLHVDSPSKAVQTWSWVPKVSSGTQFCGHFSNRWEPNLPCLLLNVIMVDGALNVDIIRHSRFSLCSL